MEFPAKITGMGSHSLLQEIFLTQGTHIHCISTGRWVLYQLSHQGIHSITYPLRMTNTRDLALPLGYHTKGQKEPKCSPKNTNATVKK